MTTELMKLRQERFCQEILKGYNQSDAYRVANPLCKRWKPETVHKKASDMMLLGEVQGRLEELKAEAKAELLKTFTKPKSEILHNLENLIKEADHIKNQYNYKDYIKAVQDCLKEQAKLLGYYEETHKHIGDPNNPINHQILIKFIGAEK
jgi:hypothetical protein